jgi:hypothetical protein
LKFRNLLGFVWFSSCSLHFFLYPLDVRRYDHWDIALTSKGPVRHVRIIHRNSANTGKKKEFLLLKHQMRVEIRGKEEMGESYCIRFHPQKKPFSILSSLNSRR